MLEVVKMDLKNDDIKKLFLTASNNRSKRVNNILKVIIKSLVDEKEEGRVVIDYKKLRNELIYFNYYDEKEEDFSYLFMYIPLIISNKRLDSGLLECLKLAKSLSSWMGESKVYISVFKAFIFFSIYRSILEMDEPEYTDCLARVKEDLIGFSPKVDRSDFVALQKFRIKLLDRIFKASKREFSQDDDKLFYDFDRLFMVAESVFYGGYHGFSEYEEVVKDFLDKVLDIVGSKVDDDSITKNGVTDNNKLLTTDKYKSSMTDEHMLNSNENYQKSKSDKNNLVAKDVGVNSKILNQGDSLDSDFFIKSADYLIRLRETMVSIKHNEIEVDPAYLLDKRVGDEVVDPVFNKIVIENNDGNTVTIVSKSGRYTLDFTRGK